jgi:hypothetical protein
VMRRRCHASSVAGVTMRCRRSSRGSSRVSADKTARSGHEGRGLPTWRRRIETSWRSTRISTSLVAERRRSKPSQPDSLTVIKYVSRNSTVGQHDMTSGEAKRQVSVPVSINGTAQAAIEVPVLVACGDIDVVGDPWAEPAAYRGTRLVTMAVIEQMAHMHNFAGSRTRLWDLIEDFARLVGSVRSGPR